MKINEMVESAHENAKSKGWWDDGDRNPLEIHALIHSEVAEATEEARKGTGPIYWETKNGSLREDGMYSDGKLQKPEGELVELADVLIRIADYCGRRGWDLQEAVRMKMAYNATRPHRHGGKKY